MPVFRLDSDTAAARGAHARILAAFGEAESAVLVGTQMVAKGHDFPEVTLTAIVDADATALPRLPRRRADLRDGHPARRRSGRGEAGGRVIVQTLAPGAPSVVHAARHDAAGFLAGELERRRALRYPPFSNLVRVELRRRTRRASTRRPRRLAGARSREALPDGTDLLGPAPMFRVRGRHRRRC